MAVTWTIVQLERQVSDDGITTAHWSASDSEIVDEITHAGNSYGSCSLSPDSTSEDFIAYADVTEANVVAWVKADLGDTMVSEIEAGIASQIALSKVPVSASGLPW